MQRVAHGTILEPVSLNHIKQRTSLTMRHILQLHLLTIARNMLVDALEHRQEFLHEGITLLVEEFAIASHLPLPDFHQGKVGFLLHLQESVALLQSLVVVGECLDVGMVVLRDDHVHQFSALFASALDERSI